MDISRWDFEEEISTYSRSSWHLVCPQRSGRGARVVSQLQHDPSELQVIASFE